ncbi:MAG: hypothetical protein M3Z37_00020 [Candidatus Eremiobacteraeota bacterium]|nr:hypothetical protein [Candidatus Eremiobacteraeota bacterium]
MTPGSTLDVAIELVIPDNTAHTALVALRRLGYGDLMAVERAEHYRIRLSAQAPQVEAVIGQLARAEVLFNPNKHRLSYAVEPATVFSDRFEALVHDSEELSDRLQRLLAVTFGMPYVVALSCGVLWRLQDADAPASAERLRWACATLLSNAVSQKSEVRPALSRTGFREPQPAAANQPG